MAIAPGVKQGVLFDLDGTLIDSTSSIQRCWGKVLDELEISRDILHSLHGAPSSESLRRLLPDADEATLSFWAHKIESYEVTDTDGIVLLPGVRETLSYLDDKNIPWIVVTSCTRDLGIARAKAVELKLPSDSVFFTDVINGKPDPEPFALGARRLKLRPHQCVAVEDAPAGIESAKSAGIHTVALETTYTKNYLHQADLTFENHPHLLSWFEEIFSV